MKTKLIGTLLCILFIGATVVPSVYGVINQNDSEPVYLEGNMPPYADFEYAQDHDNKFKFYFFSEGHSYDPDGEIIYWEWDLGDDTYSYEQNPVHTYSEELKGETIEVTLWVGDDGEPQEFDVKSKDIELPKIRYIVGRQYVGGPTASFEYNRDGLKFTFRCTSIPADGTWIESRTWDFGDGTPLGSGKVVTHVYDVVPPVTVTVMLEVEDNEGYSDRAYEVIQIKNRFCNMPLLNIIQYFDNYESNLFTIFQKLGKLDILMESWRGFITNLERFEDHIEFNA